MRPHARPRSAARQPGSAAAAETTERSLAEALLGAGHPLTRVLGRLDATFEQLVWVTAAQAGGVVLFLDDFARALSVAIAAAIVQIALTCRIGLLRASRRDLCRQLIVEGGARLPLPASSGRADASSTSEACSTWPHRSTDSWSPPLAHQHVGMRPHFRRNVRVIRGAAPELRELAALLRGGAPALEGVALVELLIASPATPLYGTELEPLRQQLRRARYLLTGHATTSRSPR